MIKWPKSVKFGQKAPFFMPQLKIKVGDLYQFHLFFKEGVVISNLIVFQEAVVISSYLNFNKIWKKCHFPIKAHAKSAFLGYLNVIVCTAKTRSMTYWFFCLIWVRRWYTLQRSDLYTSVVIHKWDQHTSLINVYSRRSGADNPRGQNFDVNRNLLSLQSFAISFKKISLKSDFIQFFSWFYTCIYM